MSKTLENLLNENNLDPQTNSQSSNNSPSDQEPSLMNIVNSILTPLVPVLVSKLTGQKLPINTVNNDQSLQQITPVLQNMISTQNILLQEIILLKRNDQNIANNFQNFRLTHEKKQLEFNQNQENHE